MIESGFNTIKCEWWHFDYKNWKDYPTLNISFEELEKRNILNNLKINLVKKDEINEVAKLYHNAWHDTYGIIAPHLSSVRTLQNCIKQWKSYFNNNNSFILVAKKNNKIIAISYAVKLLNKDINEITNYDCEIDKIYVLPSLKNQGIGTKLLKETFVKLKSLGFNKTIIRCLTKNSKANAFYEKNGGELLVKQKVQYNETMNVYGFNL